jgi:hypothetical protein
MKRLVFTLAFLALPLGAAADTPLSLLDPEIRVNATTQGAQTTPAVASTPEGSSVVVWLGPDPGGSGNLRVFGQRFDATGNRLGGELQISSGGDARQPRVAAFTDGGFVAVWTYQGVRARFYGPDGAPKGDEVLISSPVQVADADVAVNAADEAMIVWATGASPSQILARRFNARGQAFAEPLVLRSGQSYRVSVAAAPNGGFLAAWSESVNAEDGDTVWARRFDPITGAWGGQLRLTSPDNSRHFYLSLAFRPDGSFLLVWTKAAVFFPASPEFWGRSFRADGTPEGSGVRLSDQMSIEPIAVAVDRDGNALVVNDNNGSFDPPGPGVYATLFDRSWHPLTQPLRIHPVRPTREEQAVVAASAGGFLVVWARVASDPTVPAPEGTDGSSWGIFGRRLGDPRCATGSESLCLGAGGRFAARVDWKNPFTGQTGTGKALPLTGDTGAFWFFDAANLELMIKVLDGGGVNGHFWVFYGSLSNVEYTITVTDTSTGTAKTYHNAPFQFASRADVEAFPSAPAPASAAPAAVPKLSPAVPCSDSSQSLCLANGKFDVRVSFVDPRTGSTGQGKAVPLTGDTGAFWFFDPANLELMVKVLDARGVNGHFWVFYGALSDVGYTITVTDTATGATRTYHNASTTWPAGRTSLLFNFNREDPMKRCLLAFAALAALAGVNPALAAAPPAVGPNFQVNLGAQGSQLDVDVAQDTAGDTVFVWTDENTVPKSVQARVFDPSGTPLGFSFIVGLESQPISHPRVAMTPLGEFTVVWGNPRTIFVRRFDRLGRPLGSVNSTRQLSPDFVRSPDVAVDAAGNAVVVWSVSRFDGDLILLQRFNAANEAPGLGGLPEVVNQNSVNGRDKPRVALDAAGDILVSWDDYRTGNLPDVWARRFDGPTHAWAPELRINPSVPGLQQGSVPLLYPERDGAVVYSDLSEGSLRVRRLDAAGSPDGDSIQLGYLGNVDIFTPDAAAGPDRTALVVWQKDDGLVHAGFFDPSWHPLGGEFLLSSFTDDLELAPVVAAGGSGSFAAAWASGGANSGYFPELPPPLQDGRDGSGLGVFAQRFQAPACATGSEVLCLDGGRFLASVRWKNPYTGETGTGKALPLTGDTGSFWFFSPNNLELMVKVLDGTPVNNRFWLFYGSLSNVEYTLTVTDSNRLTRTYHNAPFQFGSRADVDAFFSAPPPAAAEAAAMALRASFTKAESALFAAGDCTPTPTSLCAQNRFQITVDFIDPRTATQGQGRAVSLTNDTGVFWFFAPENLELMVKVLDGSGVNGHFWVFYGGLSDVDYTIRVTDTATGATRTYHNPLHHLASGSDVTAFTAGPTAGQ